MISNLAVNYIENKLGYVVRSFGNIDKFLEVLNYDEIKLQDILSYYDSTIVLSAWNITFKLYTEFESSFQTDSINFNEPYQVLDYKGKVLYEVSNHSGFFGNSTLDKILLLQSKTGDIYYIHYPTYEGEMKTKLLLVNNQVITPIINTPIAKTPSVFEIKDTKLNQIIFNTSNIGSDNYINTYFLASAPVRIPRKEALKSNPYSQVTKQKSGGQISQVFDKSGWLVITKLDNNTETFLKINNVIGVGVDRFLAADETNYIYYVAVGKDVDITTAKQIIRTSGLSNSNQPLSETINLQANLLV